jgi:hypothetical protein
MAQTQLAREYSYDASGNRTVCAVINFPSPAPPPIDSTKIEAERRKQKEEMFIESDDLVPQTAKYFVETIAQVEIKIYPNPATEKITLEFSGAVETQCIASLRLFSLKGQLLHEQEVYSSATEVSLTGLAKGAYILKVQIKDITEEWKIIKN